MKRLPGNQQLVRITNQNLIIDEIRKHGPISRAELAKMLNLSAPSVSSNIDKLISRGILYEAGEGISSGGRKPVLLKFNYDFGNIVGVDLTGDRVKVALGNLEPSILMQTSFEVPENMKGEQVLQLIIEKIDGMISEKGKSIRKIMAVAIAFPGAVDVQTGNIIYSKRFYEWASLNIKKAFEEHFSAPLILKNDINTAALGELWYGCGKGCSNLVYVGVDVGIGAGIVIDGRLYEGSHSCAGEIFRLAVSPEALEEKYREEGHLEKIASKNVLVENIREKVKGGANSLVLELASGNPDGIGFLHVAQALQKGDKLCLECTVEYAEILGVAVSNIINILDVELVIIGNEVMKLGSPFLEAVRNVVGRLTAGNASVVYPELGMKSVIYGTFALGLNCIFENIAE